MPNTSFIFTNKQTNKQDLSKFRYAPIFWKHVLYVYWCDNVRIPRHIQADQQMDCDIPGCALTLWHRYTNYVGTKHCFPIIGKYSNCIGSRPLLYFTQNFNITMCHMTNFTTLLCYCFEKKIKTHTYPHYFAILLL